MLVINCSNLHVGGGVQVAVSFLSELSRMRDKAGEFVVCVSTEVDADLMAAGAQVSFFKGYSVQNTNRFNISSVSREGADDYNDVVFTVFGPLYRLAQGFINVVGFAQPWIIFPENDVYPRLTVQRRVFLKTKFLIQKLFFKQSHILVVELPHVKRGLIDKLGVPPHRIRVVPNCVSSVYFNPEVWRPVSIQVESGVLRLGFIGRKYLHKNTEIFPAIARELISRFGLRARFFVTFSEAEWNECPDDFKSVAVNVGVLSVVQCPSFLSQMDGIVLPSLLECFSATPFEAMIMGKPVFLSDRQFFRDTCGRFGIYFDPLSPEAAAAVIGSYYTDGADRVESLASARSHAVSFSNAKGRATLYAELLLSLGRKKI